MFTVLLLVGYDSTLVTRVSDFKISNFEFVYVNHSKMALQRRNEIMILNSKKHYECKYENGKSFDLKLFCNLISYYHFLCRMYQF